MELHFYVEGYRWEAYATTFWILWYHRTNALPYKTQCKCKTLSLFKYIKSVLLLVRTINEMLCTNISVHIWDIVFLITMFYIPSSWLYGLWTPLSTLWCFALNKTKHHKINKRDNLTFALLHLSNPSSRIEKTRVKRAFPWGRCSKMWINKCPLHNWIICSF